MGCISSKNAVARTCSPSPAVLDIAEPNPAYAKGHSWLPVLESKTGSEDERSNSKFRKNSSKKSSGSFSFRHVEAEQNAAGWPPWLIATAAEAIQGWIPLKADSFQKLEKVLYQFL